MKKVLAFGASNSSTWINKVFASFAAQQLEDSEVILVDLNDFVLPLYSMDMEKEYGVNEKVHDFYALIQASDAIVISLSKYNGLHTSAFKNLWDWLSRIPMKKPMYIWMVNLCFFCQQVLVKDP